MQSKFTRKKKDGFNRFISMLIALSFLLTGKIIAQTTITTEGGTNYSGNNNFGAVNSAVTFVVENTNATPIVLTEVHCYLTAAFTGTIPSLWYSTTSLSGVPAIASPLWTQVATGGPVMVAANGIIPVLTGLSITIPANTVYRFALQSSLGLAYSGTGTGTGAGQPTPNTFSADGVNLKLGNSQITGFNTGYGGSFASPTFTARFFTGRIKFAPAIACSGNPLPGNTQSSVSTVCPLEAFSLSTQIPVGTTGLTYQWQISPDGNSWSNAQGAGTSASYIASQTNATYYRCQVTCSGNTTASSPLLVPMTPLMNCYCSAGAVSTLFEKISNVSFGTINSNSTSGAGYENFTALSTTVYKGISLPVSISINPGYSTDQAYVWIDFNQNGNFGDPGEQVFISGAGAGPYTGAITIPATALTGPTRMRVRMQDTNPIYITNNTPCGTSAYGQVEDYTIDIQPCVQGVILSNPSNASTECSGNASFAITATGSLLNYSWQYRVNNSSPWLTVPNTAPFFGAGTTNLVIRDVPTTMNGYEFRAVIQGGCTAVDFSAPAALTVAPLTATVSPATASVCLGTIQKLTLTNPTSVAVYGAPTNLPLTITDNDITGNSSVIHVSGVPAGAVVTDVTVSFSMTHTWVGDMVMNLKAPNGQVLNLVGALNNGNGDNGTADFLNTKISSTAVAALSGAAAPRTGIFKADAFHPISIPVIATTTTNTWAPLLSMLNGDWSLVSCDIGPGDIGILSNWSINISYVAPPAQGLWGAVPLLPNTMFTDATASIPYVPGTPANAIWVKPAVSTNYSVVYTTPTPCTSLPTVIPVSVVVPINNLVNPANTNACIGGTASFTVSAGGGPLSYQWEESTDGGLLYNPIPGANTSILNLTAITSSMNGNRYRCILNAAPCSGSVTSAAATLTVNSLPVVTLSAATLLLTPGQTTTITASSIPGGAVNGWGWTYNGAMIPGNNTNTISGITVDRLGTYSASVTDINGCTASSANILVSAAASDRLWIYPNPTSGVFQVRLYTNPASITSKRAVYIYNSQGQLITSREFDLFNTSAPYQQMDFDLGRAAGGSYLVKVVDKYTGKIVSGIVIVQ